MASQTLRLSPLERLTRGVIGQTLGPWSRTHTDTNPNADLAAVAEVKGGAIVADFFERQERRSLHKENTTRLILADEKNTKRLMGVGTAIQEAIATQTKAMEATNVFTKRLTYATYALVLATIVLAGITLAGYLIPTPVNVHIGATSPDTGHRDPLAIPDPPDDIPALDPADFPEPDPSAIPEPADDIPEPWNIPEPVGDLGDLETTPSDPTPD